ncbi:MAG: hypothetical protein AAAB36_15670 [Ensifer adhaerens]
MSEEKPEQTFFLNEPLRKTLAQQRAVEADSAFAQRGTEVIRRGNHRTSWSPRTHEAAISESRS